MLEAKAVKEYLEAHPEFFDDHPHLLETLTVPHAHSGGAVSLVERQVKVLRERQAASRERLAELVRVARDNESLTGRVHHLALRLLRARTASDVEAQVMASMHEDFAVTPVRLLHRAPDTAGLESVWSAGRPRCGHFAEQQRTALFGAEAAELRSMAVIPLGAGATRGVLALGSLDADRFNPGISTDFLLRIGELVAAALARCGVEPAA
jgi:uncharacterized protein YigA (DUF484 family)